MSYPYPNLFTDTQRAKKSFVESWESNGKPIRRSLKRYDRDQSDMSPFSFILTLLLIGTVAATYSNDPAFWLLVGPAPLAAVFTTTTLFRRKWAGLLRHRILICSKRRAWAIFGHVRTQAETPASP